MSLSMLRRLMAGMSSDQRGFTALEYALIMVLVGSAIMGCVQLLGTSLNSSYTHLGNVLLRLASGV